MLTMPLIAATLRCNRTYSRATSEMAEEAGG
jgi:hypothetical protein